MALTPKRLEPEIEIGPADSCPETNLNSFTDLTSIIDVCLSKSESIASDW